MSGKALTNDEIAQGWREFDPNGLVDGDRADDEAKTYVAFAIGKQFVFVEAGTDYLIESEDFRLYKFKSGCHTRYRNVTFCAGLQIGRRIRSGNILEINPGNLERVLGVV